MSHPLLNPLVAYEILRQLPRSDVLNCRLVSSVWNTEGCRLLRKILTLDFHDLCQVHKFHLLLDDAASLRAANENSELELPFAKVHLRASFRLGHSVAQEFFKAHGHIIQHLTILKVDCDCGANFFQKLLFYQANLTSLNLQIISAPIRLSPESGYFSTMRSLTLHNPPNSLQLPWLKHLHLRQQLFLERSSFIRELLNATVNLESLITDPGSPEFCSGVFLPALLNSRNSWSKLRRLLCGTSITLTDMQIQGLCSRNIFLEELRLQFNHPHYDPVCKEDILQLLKHMRTSLKILELNNRHIRCETEFPFELDILPKLSKVESIRLVNIKMEPKWLKLMPGLRSCDYVEENPVGIGIPLGNFGCLSLSGVHPSIRRLSLSPLSTLNIVDMQEMSLWWNENGDYYVKKIAHIFPKLRSLSLNGNDTILKGIYKHFPDLEELTVHGPVSDEGVTGIPIQLCLMMHMEQDYNINMEQIGPTTFIGNLSRLRKLRIMAPAKCSLTEVSIFFGFVCCKDLVHLEVNNPELIKIWKEEVSRMEEIQKPS